MRRRLGLAAALLLVTGVLAACGEDDGDGDGKASASDTPSYEVVEALSGPDPVPDEGEPETTSITSYDARFDVDAEGDLEAVETVTVLFPEEGKHGIYRFWDREDPHSSDEHEAEDITATADGEPAVVALSVEDDRYQVARIGDPDVTLPVGEHDFEISYAVSDVLTEEGTVFYWTLVPAGWRQPITEATLTVTLPGDAIAVECGVGNDDDLAPCEVDGEGSDELTVHVTDVAALTGVTIRAFLG